MHSGYKNLPQLPCAFLGCHPHATVCVLGLPPTSHHPTSHIPHHPHATVCVCGLPPALPTRPPTQPATHPTSTSHNPPHAIHMLPCAFVGCLRPVLAWALVALGSLWHWAVAPSASMLHCTVAVCSVASLTGSHTRLRTPGKHRHISISISINIGIDHSLFLAQDATSAGEELAAC